MPFADTEAMQAHLGEIGRTVARGAHAVLLLDRAGWHTTEKLTIPKNLTLILLPSRSPELNPVENIWQFLRANWLSNRVFETYDEIIGAACEAWKKLPLPSRHDNLDRHARLGAYRIIQKGRWYNPRPRREASHLKSAAVSCFPNVWMALFVLRFLPAPLMNNKDLTKAVAYLRTSSATNTGPDKDSEKRQRAAIEAFARSAGYKIVESYYDAAVSGADPVTARPGFSSMLERLMSNGVRSILVETASRFARDLIVQETGYELLKARGIELIAVDSPHSFVADTPTARLIRQVLGAVSEFEKAMLVEKLKGARERKRRETGRKVGGRKNYGEIEGGPEMIALAKKLHRYPVNGRKRTLADVSGALAAAGYLSSAGTPFSASAIKRMLARKGSELPSQKVQAAIPSPSVEPVPSPVWTPLPELGSEPEDDVNIMAALKRARRLREEQAGEGDKRSEWS